VHHVRAVGRLDGEPVALLTGAYPTSVSRVLTRPAVIRVGTHQLLATRAGSRTTRTSCSRWRSPARRRACCWRCPEGTSFVCIRSKMHTADGELIEVTRELYRSDRFEFSYTAASSVVPTS